MYVSAMRTTLTLDDDVAALLSRIREEKKLGLKEAINEALRCGLRQMAAPPPKRKPFKVEPLPVAEVFVDNVDNIAEILAMIEGDHYR
jgi:hypothetical protein